MYDYKKDHQNPPHCAISSCGVLCLYSQTSSYSVGNMTSECNIRMMKRNGVSILTQFSSIDFPEHCQDEFWPPGSESCLIFFFFLIKLFSLRQLWIHIQL